MVLFECGSPFQPKPSYVRFGDFRRVMWGWFAVTTYPYGVNELFEGLGRAGAQLYSEGDAEMLDEPSALTNGARGGAT